MIKNYIHLILAMLLFFARSFNCLSQSSLIETFASTTISSNIGGFLVYVPSDYNTTNKYYPLLIFDHGQGENGNGSNPFNAITTNGPFKEIKLSHAYISGLYDQFIILGPQFKGYPQTEDTDSCIAYMKKNYRIRGDVFLTGLSQGGGGVWNSASSSTVTKLAAVVPICGASAPSNYKISFLAPNNLPVWAFHGTADPTVPVTQSQDWVNMINAYIPTPNPLAKLTTFLGVGHDSWSTVYAGYSESGVNIYQWMLGYDTSPKQTITGLNGISNKLVGEYFGLSASATSSLSVSYQIASSPSIGVFTTVTGNQLSCTGIGVVTITAFQNGNNVYAPARNVVSIFSITGYLGTISGMPSDNSQIYYGSSLITISGGSALNPLNLSYSSVPPSGVITIIGNSIKTLGVGNVTLTGILSNQTLTSTFDILPAILTVTAAQNSKIYGQANPSFSGTISGLVNADVVNASYFSNANNLSGIGNYSIFPSVTGAALVNYQLSTIAGILAVQKAALSANVANANKIYGQANPSFSGTISGLVNGDVVNAAYFSNANNLSGIGNYSIFPSVTGAALVNYQLSTIAGILAVQKAALSANVANANKIYGQANPSFSGTISGLVNADVVNAAYFSNANNLSGVGNYSIFPSVTGAALVNYQLSTIAGILAVQKAALSITVANANKIYGQANPSFSGTISGLVNADVVNAAYFSNANNLSGVGNYSIFPSVTGAALVNYQLSTIAGILAVQKAALAINCGNANKIYGQSNPSFSGTISGLVNADAVNAAYFSNANNLSGVGNYSIFPSVTGAALVNYQLSTIAGILAVQKATLSINVGNANKIYAQSNPSFSGTISGLVNGDVVNAAYFSNANNLSGVGNYSIFASVTGAALVNYQLTTSSGILTIQKATVSITAANTSKTYGLPNPIFACSISGMVNGETLNVSYITNLDSLTDVGNYPIYPSVSGAALVNYQLSTIAGILSIQKASLTIKSAHANKIYGQSNPIFSGTISGLIKKDVANVSYFSDANPFSNAGNYSILAAISGSALSNYFITTIAGVLEVAKSELTVTAISMEKVSSDPNPKAFSYSIAGFVNDENENVFIAPVQIGSTAPAKASFGNYPITVAGASALNYNFKYQSGVLRILFKVSESAPKPTISGIAMLNTNNTLTLTGIGLSLVESICFQTASEIFCVIPTSNLDSILTINPPNGLLKTGSISVTGNFGIAEYSLAIVSSNDDFISPDSLEIYPNPSEGEFIVKGVSFGELYIYSLLGQKIKSFEIKNNASFELTEKGIYFLYIKTEKTLAIKKLLVH